MPQPESAFPPRQGIRSNDPRAIAAYGLARFQDNHASAFLGWKPQHLAEIVIQCHENAPFVSADFEELFVRRAPKLLIDNGHDVMPRTG